MGVLLSRLRDIRTERILALSRIADNAARLAPPEKARYPPGMAQKPLSDPADHAQGFARDWQPELESYCSVRMDEVGVPEHLIGTDDLRAHMKWTTFDPEGREGG